MKAGDKVKLIGVRPECRDASFAVARVFALARVRVPPSAGPEALPLRSAQSVILRARLAAVDQKRAHFSEGAKLSGVAEPAARVSFRRGREAAARAF